MIRRLLAGAALWTILIAQSGCASVFSGTHQEVRFVSDPPGASVIVVGGSAGELVLDAKKQSDRLQIAIAMLRSMAPEEYGPALARLEALRADELIPKLVTWLEESRLPAELASLPPVAIPRGAKMVVLEVLGVGPCGATPYTGEVRRGSKYAVIVRLEGYRPKIVALDESFNWVFLLNIFNAFMLCPVDIVSGSWYGVDADEVVVTLEPEPRAPGAPLRVAGR
jgi:hypothetical protein